MTAPLQPPPTNPSANSQLRTRRPTSRRILAIALTIVLGALTTWFTISQVTTQEQVILVTSAVARGETIERTDLSEVTVGALGGASSVPAAQINELIGQQALADLTPGMVLPANAVGSAAAPRPYNALVGLRLEQGRLTAGDLRAGSPVLLVVTDQSAEADTGDTSPQIYRATLISSEAGLDGATTIANVEVALAQAPQVAAYAAASRISLVLEAPR